MTNPAERTRTALRTRLVALAAVPGRPSDALRLDAAARAELRELYRCMLLSRELDHAARDLKAADRGYYTIASAGHEMNVVVGAALRHTDPCFLHYRSGALMAARRRDDLDGFVRDTLASFAASTTDPISGGRHKVWGSPVGWTPPQTSTIASHLPKAVGTAVAIGRSSRPGFVSTPALDEIGADGVVAVSFGDASANHATATAAFTMARWSRRVGSAVPILFVCEDNGLGISVETPRNWIESTFSAMPGMGYVRADGDLETRRAVVADAVARVRESRAPMFVHLPTVRLWGHAGSDVEQGYRAPHQIRASEAADPLVSVADWLVAHEVVSAAALLEDLDDVERRVAGRMRELDVVHANHADDVIGPLTMTVTVPSCGAVPAPTEDQAEARAVQWPNGAPEAAVAPVRRTLAANLNAALHDAMANDPHMLAFGEDVGRKGGVYGVTSGLQDRHGTARVFDTLLDETSILGAAQGFALVGHLPVPEIQYLAYVHNALDQIRGEAASTAWLSAEQFATPMVMRIAGLAYQRGFGGHFHNDNSIGALRDIPGLFLAVPSRGDDAVRMFRSALDLARRQRRVVAFLEPIALYHERDLHGAGDDGWLTSYPASGPGLPPGEAGVYPAGQAAVESTEVAGHVLPHAPQVLPAGRSRHDARLGDYADVVIATYGNGVRMALRAARRLATERVRVRVLDLRWLNPLPMEAVAAHAAEVGRLLVVDECRRTGGGIADAVLAGLVESGVAANLASVRAEDSYVPLGPAAGTVLVDEDQVVAAAMDLAASHR